MIKQLLARLINKSYIHSVELVDIDGLTLIFRIEKKDHTEKWFSVFSKEDKGLEISSNHKIATGLTTQQAMELIIIGEVTSHK